MNGSPKFRLPAILVEASIIMALLVPMLYTAGWSYIYQYFEHFHLGLIGLEISKEYLFMYSFWALQDQLYLSVISLIMMLITGIMAGYCTSKAQETGDNLKKPPKTASGSRWRQIVILFMLPIFILGLFFLFYLIGNRAAQSHYIRQAKSDFQSYPSVKVWLTEEARKEVGEMAAEWEKGCYRLLLRNKDFVYLFYPANYTDKIPTEIISSDKVRMIRVLPYSICTENFLM